MSRSATVRAPSAGLTAAEFAARAAEFEHCELLHGEVVPMAPTKRRHGWTESRLTWFLVEYVDMRGAGEVAGGEVGFQLAQDHVRAADVALYLDAPPLERGPGFETRPPDLVVEVVSPHDSWPYVEEKVQDWFEAGVREVWLADPQRRAVTVRRPDGTSRVVRDTGGRERDELCSELLPGFAEPVARLFPPPEPAAEPPAEPERS